MAINVGNTSLPSNADSVYAVKDGVKINLDEIQCIYQGKTLSIWKKQKYYFVVFNSNGGTGSMNQQTMPVGVATALTANAFSRLGYLFSAWAKSSSGSAAYSDKQSVKDIAAAGEAITLYALWTAITYYVVYNANGGSGSMSNSEHKYDTAKALTANAFSKTGYLFTGWDTDASGDVVYADKASVKNLASTHGAKVNLYAVWTAITWYVRYNGNGATSGSMADSTHKYDTAKALTTNAYSRKGYQFTGWATSSSGAKAYDDKALVKNLKSIHGAVLNLYALWSDAGYYAIQDGKLANCPNASAWCSGQYGQTSGEVNNSYGVWYGGFGYTNGAVTNGWGADTGLMTTQGCPNLYIKTYVIAHNGWSPTLAVYDAAGNVIHTYTIDPETYPADGGKYYTATINISAYSSVRVRINAGAGDDTDAWMCVGFKDIRIYN